MTIDDTIKFYESMVSRQLKAQLVEWNEFGLFLTALRELQKVSSETRPPFEIEELLRNAGKVKRILMGSPIPPDICAPRIDLQKQAIEIVRGTNYEKSVNQLCSAINVLIDSTNPASKITEEIVNRYSVNGYTDQIVLIVSTDSRQYVNEWINTNGLNVNVATATESKSLPPWDIGILYGVPENHVWSFNIADRTSDAAWLINDAPAKNMEILIGPGNPKFTSVRYAPWEEVDDFKVTQSAPQMFLEFVDDIPAQWTSTAPIVRSRDGAHGVAHTTAVPVALGGGGWVFFSKQDSLGLQPRVISLDSTGIKLKNLKLSEMQNDLSNKKIHFLVIPTSRANRQYLRDTASNWLARKYGESSDFIGHVDEFRFKVQTFSLSPGALEKLTGRSMEKTMARRWLKEIWVDGSIAPEDRLNIKYLAEESGFNFSTQLVNAIVKVRTAMRKAGDIAQKELVAELMNSSDWQDSVKAGRSHRVEIASVGSILVAAAMEVLSTEQEVPISILGRYIDDNGEEVED